MLLLAGLSVLLAPCVAFAVAFDLGGGGLGAVNDHAQAAEDADAGLAYEVGVGE